MAKKRLIEKEIKKSSVFRSPLVIGMIIILIAVIALASYDLKRVLYGPVPCALAMYVSTDRDNDGFKDVCGDTCISIYNPTQDKKYCNPFYGLALSDDPDKDFIPNSLKYSSVLGFYIGEVAGQESIFTDLKTRPVNVRIGTTGTVTKRLLTASEISKLAYQGTSSSPSPSPSSSP